MWPAGVCVLAVQTQGWLGARPGPWSPGWRPLLGTGVRSVLGAAWSQGLGAHRLFCVLLLPPAFHQGRAGVRAAGVVSPHFSLFSKRCPANKLPDAELSLEVAEGMVGVFLPLLQAPGSLLRSSPAPCPRGHSIPSSTSWPVHLHVHAYVCTCVHMCLHVCVCTEHALLFMVTRHSPSPQPGNCHLCLLVIHSLGLVKSAAPPMLSTVCSGIGHCP